MHYHDPDIQNRIDHLFNNMPVASRISTAKTVAHDYKSENIEGDDFFLAELLLKFLLNDVETEVRFALSDQLKDYPQLPRKWALKLAMDLETVALPILKFSRALRDEDLVEIFKSASKAKQICIAQRDNLSPILTDCIAEIGCLDAVKECLKNHPAEISEYGFDHILIRYKKREDIHHLIVRRPTLPDRIIKHLIQLVSEEIKTALLNKKGVPDEILGKMVENAKEQALVKQLKRQESVHEKQKAAVQLEADGKLTATLMLRSLILGDYVFFSAGISQTTGISLKKVSSLISDTGFIGLKRLFGAACLPQYLYPAYKAALEDMHLSARHKPCNDIDKNLQNIIDKISLIYNYEEGLTMESLMEKLLLEPQ